MRKKQKGTILIIVAGFRMQTLHQTYIDLLLVQTYLLLYSLVQLIKPYSCGLTRSDPNWYCNL